MYGYTHRQTVPCIEFHYAQLKTKRFCPACDVHHNLWIIVCRCGSTQHTPDRARKPVTSRIPGSATQMALLDNFKSFTVLIKWMPQTHQAHKQIIDLPKEFFWSRKYLNWVYSKLIFKLIFLWCSILRKYVSINNPFKFVSEARFFLSLQDFWKSQSSFMMDLLTLTHLLMHRFMFCER